MMSYNIFFVEFYNGNIINILHHIDSFPIDVWMKRILAEQYPEGYPFDRYSPYNGIYQQYMFAFYRHFY